MPWVSAWHSASASSVEEAGPGGPFFFHSSVYPLYVYICVYRDRGRYASLCIYIMISLEESKYQNVGKLMPQSSPPNHLRCWIGLSRPFPTCETLWFHDHGRVSGLSPEMSRYGVYSLYPCNLRGCTRIKD